MSAQTGLVITLIVLVVLAVVFMRFRFKRSTDKALEALAAAGAFTIPMAKTRDELGLGKRPLWWRMGMRDYTEMTFNALVQSGIVLITDEGKYYIPKEHYDSYRAKKTGRV